jgi:hypothetical protein
MENRGREKNKTNGGNAYVLILTILCVERNFVSLLQEEIKRRLKWIMLATIQS